MTNDEYPSTPAVELRQVSKAVAQVVGRVILDAVSLRIARGEFFALIGPSGSGKSTLLKMVSGIDTPTAGEVWLAGRNVTAIPPYHRPVHTVFQNYALFPHLDVAGNVGFPLRIAGMPRPERLRRIQQALSWVHLDKFASRRIENLSGGERQRVALARALVDEPECVLLDEPLAALDPHLRSHTLELLQEIQSRLRITYLYVTHDRQEALRAADRIGVLHQGRLQQVGTPEELYHRPASVFVASFIGPISWLEGELTHQDDGPAVLLATGERLLLNGDVVLKSPRVKVGIRPEDIWIGKDGFLSAQVEQRQFCGASVSLRLRTANGASLAAELRGDLGDRLGDRLGDQSPPAVGEQVRIGWTAQKAHVFAV